MRASARKLGLGARLASASPSPYVVGMASHPCPDCGSPADGLYCSSCGQRLDIDPTSLRHWMRESLDEVVSVDGKLLRSLHALLFRPGYLTAEWRAGRRASWTSPFRLYLLCSLAFFTTSLVLPVQGSFSVQTEPVADIALADAIQSAQEAALATVAPQVLIALVPVLALILRLVFGGRLYFVEHLVHAVHLQSFLLLLLLAVFIGPFLPPPLMMLFGWAVILTLVAYWVRSFMRVYGRGVVGSALSVVLSVSGYAIAVLLALGGVVTVVAADPLDDVRTAEDAYWSLEARWASGDTVDAASRARSVAIRFRRLESHMLDAAARAHAAEMLVAGDSIRDGLVLARQGLVAAPGDPLLLGVAAEAALQLGDSAAARGYAVRLLDARDPPSLDPRDRAGLERARRRAAELAGRGPPGG